MTALAGACAPVSRTFENTGGGGSGGGGGTGGSAQLCEPGTSAPCYTGPPGTEDTGACKMGTHTCLPGGDGFGECTGEVVPQPEICTTQIDEGCDGPNPIECPSLGHVWSKSFGGADEDATTAIVIEPKTGDIIATGYFRDTIDFGNGPMASTGSDDIFLVRLTADGQVVWAKRFGDAASQQPRDMALDPNGAIYVVGEMAGQIDFGDGMPKVSNGLDDAFVAKFDLDGNIIWSRLFGDSSSQSAKGVALTPTNQVVVVGNYSGFIQLTGMELPSNMSRDVFVIKLDSSGFDVGAKHYGSTSSDDVMDVAVDSTGATLITGYFYNMIDFGTLGTFTSAGSTDAFVLKLAPDFGEQWVQTYGDVESQRGNAVVTGPNDDVFLTGDFEGTIVLGDGSSLTAPPQERSPYLIALAGDGAHKWGKSAASTMTLTVESKLKFDPATQSLIAVGFFNGSLDFGGGPLAANLADAFVVKMGLDGSHLASKRFGGAGIDAFFSAGVSSTGDIFVVGGHLGPADFGGGELPASAGQNDVQALFLRLLP